MMTRELRVPMGKGHAKRLVLAAGLALAVVRSAAAEQAVDHSVWDRLLHRYVQDGLVDYQALSSNDRADLDRYLSSLKTVVPGQLPTKDAELAFWINAYNAFVFKGVLDHYPLKSVKDVKGFFDSIPYSIAGGELTLNQIEAKGRALGNFRIHFAVVCASSSCPILRSEAYVPERLAAQLTEQATQFLSKPQRGFRIEGDTVWISKIFKWYARDFIPGGKMTLDTLLPVIRPYLSLEIAAQLGQPAKFKLKFMEYDWTLNNRSAVNPAAEAQP